MLGQQFVQWLDKMERFPHSPSAPPRRSVPSKAREMFMLRPEEGDDRSKLRRVVTWVLQAQVIVACVP